MGEHDDEAATLSDVAAIHDVVEKLRDLLYAASESDARAAPAEPDRTRDDAG